VALAEPHRLTDIEQEYGLGRAEAKGWATPVRAVLNVAAAEP
jgi:hypothetical protein